MLKVLDWAVPLFISVLLIQAVSDMLYMQAMERRPADAERLDGERYRLPVHVIDRDARAGSIIT